MGREMFIASVITKIQNAMDRPVRIRSLQLFSNLKKGGTNMKHLLSFFAAVVLLGAQSLQAQWIQTNGPYGAMFDALP